MSLTGSTTDTNLSVLRGKITSVSPYAIDPSLTTEGAAADAKATGNAIETVKFDSNSHINSVGNPHKVTKAQVGLGDVDNTADIDKPVSRLQAEAIADAKKAGTDAMAALNVRNEFTDEEKAKLAGIEAGANKFVLTDGAVTTAIIADGAVTNSKLGYRAVTVDKVADNAITRQKLNDDARYSSIYNVPASAPTVTLSTDYLGKTFRYSSGTTDYIINIVKDANIPVSAEIAVFNNWSKTNKIVFGSDAKAAVVGQSNYLTGATLTIPDTFGMIALKKIASDTDHDYWLVTGNVEVV